MLPCVVLLDRESSTLHPGSGPSLPPEWLAALDGAVIGPNIGTCGAAAWSGELTITEDIALDPKWAPIREPALRLDLRHCWSMPFKSPDGDVLGTLALYGHQPRAPQPEHLALMDVSAQLAAIAIGRHRTMEQLRHDARHDGLTGLANRTAIFEHLDAAIAHARGRRRVAVLFVDLDGLKTLNDTFGHDRADEMIREVGSRLAGAIRPSDFVGRFGGDEFVVIAEGVRSQAEAGEIGARLLEVVSEPLPGVEGIVVTASIGIAVLGNASDAREALREADSAMYAAKRSGRDRLQFFEGKQPTRTGPAPRARPRARARPSRAARCASSSNRSSTRRTPRSSASRRCCAGTAGSSARSLRPSSSRSPRRPERSSRSARGCCARAARRSCASAAKRAERSSWA